MESPWACGVTYCQAVVGRRHARAQFLKGSPLPATRTLYTVVLYLATSIGVHTLVSDNHKGFTGSQIDRMTKRELSDLVETYIEYIHTT